MVPLLWLSRLLIPGCLLLATCSFQQLIAGPLCPAQAAQLLSFRNGAADRLPSGGGKEPDGAGTLMPGAIGLICGVALTTPVVVWLNRRQQRKLQEQRALLGDELHDQLGPMIYYSRMLVASEIRRQEAPSESMLELQNQLAQTGETVRDLSRTLRNEGATTLAALEAFVAMQLERWHLLGGAAYIVHGHIPDVTLSLAQYTQLLRVIQELMLNTCRHAPGKAIHLAFESGRRNLNIRYWDEGPGMDPAFCSGTGADSTVSRMKRIGGTLRVNNRFPDGYEIDLSLPL